MKVYFPSSQTAQKMKFSIKDFLSEGDQILRKKQIRSHLLTKFLMKNFIFYVVLLLFAVLMKVLRIVIVCDWPYLFIFLAIYLCLFNCMKTAAKKVQSKEDMSKLTIYLTQRKLISLWYLFLQLGPKQGSTFTARAVLHLR